MLAKLASRGAIDIDCYCGGDSAGERAKPVQHVLLFKPWAVSFVAGTSRSVPALLNYGSLDEGRHIATSQSACSCKVGFFLASYQQLLGAEFGFAAIGELNHFFDLLCVLCLKGLRELMLRPQHERLQRESCMSHCTEFNSARSV